MYRNSGKSIKDIVSVVVGVQMMLYVIVAIILMAAVGGGAGFFLGLVVAGGGCFFAWLSGLILHAFGEIADNAKMITKLLMKLVPDTPQVTTEAAEVSHVDVQSIIDNVDSDIENQQLSKFQNNMIKEYRAQLRNGVISAEVYQKRVESVLKGE